MDAKSQLEQITTRPDEKPAERVLRYHRAIRNRLRKFLPEDLADQILSDIVVKIYSGKFDAWVPGTGRFHHYLARSINNAVADFFRRRKRQTRFEATRPEAIAQAAAPDDMAHEFGRGVIHEALRQLSRYQQTRNLHHQAGGRCGPNAYYTILRLRAKHPDLSNEDLIARLPWRFRKWFASRPAAFRKQLQHARELFAALLVIEAAAPYQDIQADLPTIIGPALVQTIGGKLRDQEWLRDLLRELKLWSLVQGLGRAPAEPNGGTP